MFTYKVYLINQLPNFHTCLCELFTEDRNPSCEQFRESSGYWSVPVFELLRKWRLFGDVGEILGWLPDSSEISSLEELRMSPSIWNQACNFKLQSSGAVTLIRHMKESPPKTPICGVKKIWKKQQQVISMLFFCKCVVWWYHRWIPHLTMHLTRLSNTWQLC
jgi:hypothetical protein